MRLVSDAAPPPPPLSSRDDEMYRKESSLFRSFSSARFPFFLLFYLFLSAFGPRTGRVRLSNGMRS